ncbi:MAG TPA: M15 family metallopeptidase [Patescibacteria group bacterium]|nr:M15 family metallopeptidase [Patescibacteria group bacterium]
MNSTSEPVPVSTEPLVNIAHIDPRIVLDIRYATTNNFTGKILYSEPKCFLRLSVAEKLRRVQNDLEPLGLGLKIYDGYRPLSVQRELWRLTPSKKYVANPAIGSKHNRGAAVDLTLIQLYDCAELPMPSGYDEFTKRAHRNYVGASAQEKKNSGLLEFYMMKHGFLPLPHEWWHYDVADWRKFPITDIPLHELR